MIRLSSFRFAVGPSGRPVPTKKQKILLVLKSNAILMDMIGEKLFKEKSDMFTNQQYTCLVKKYIDTVFRVALGYTKSATDAEDIVQDVFLALWKEKKAFESEEHIRAWLIRVTVNACKKWHRSPWRKHISYEEYIAAQPETTDAERDILRAVMDLPRKYRLPIYLYYYEEYSTAEIGEILKLPKGTVCTYLSRGREMLKLQLMEDEEYA